VVVWGGEVRVRARYVEVGDEQGGGCRSCESVKVQGRSSQRLAQRSATSGIGGMRMEVDDGHIADLVRRGYGRERKREERIE
jgi:hypothetical protein